MSPRAAVFSATLLSGAIVFSATAADWPHWRGPSYDGISQEKGWTTTFPAAGPKQLWKANVGTGFSSLTVAKGRVYTMGNTQDQDTVFCFDAETGQVVWKYSYACPLDPKYYEGGTSGTPTVDGDFIYTLSRKGHLLCLKDGKVVWQKNVAEAAPKGEIPTWGFAGSPVISGNLLIVNVGAAGTAFDKKTGALVWSNGSTVSGYSSAVPAEFGGQKCVVLALSQTVAALSLTDGKKLWEHPWKTQYDVNAAEPVISGQRVFISSGYNHGCSVFSVDGGQTKTVWENKNLRNHLNSSVLLDGFLYGIDGNAAPDATLRCVEFTTGEVKWSQKGLGGGSLLLADGQLIILSEKGELVIAPATTKGFTPSARAQVLGGKCWTVPVLANGRIYARNARGDVVALDVKGK